MNNKPFPNLIMFFIGLALALVFATSNDWSKMISAVGIIIATMGVTNATFYFFPINNSADDWIIPILLTVLFILLVATLRHFEFFGLSGFSLTLADTTSKILAFVPATRLYIIATRSTSIK